MKLLDDLFYGTAMVVVYVVNVLLAYGLRAYDWWNRNEEDY